MSSIKPLKIIGGNDYKMNNNVPNIYIINLDRRADRLTNITKQLKQLKLLFIRYSAFDGNNLTEGDKNYYISESGKKESRAGLKLTNGAIGLGITLYKLCSSCIEDKDEIIILEDDAVLEDDFINKFIDMKKQLKDIDYDMVYLGHHTIDKKKLEKKTKNIYKIDGQINGTFGLLIKPSACKKIIEEVFPLNWQIDTAIYMNKNIQKYVVEPPLITSEPSTAENSDIQF
tara:strand:+ start:800 stop:1486 length:687 start_codon:yes stop_codon:yes gene_type:complete